MFYKEQETKVYIKPSKKLTPNTGGRRRRGGGGREKEGGGKRGGREGDEGR